MEMAHVTLRTFDDFFFFQVKMLLYTIEFSELLHFELQLRGGEK